MSRLRRLVGETDAVYTRASGSFLAGAIAFQAVLSLAPLLIVATFVVGAVLGRDAARGALEQNLTHTLGVTGARTVAELVAATNARGDGVLATVVGIVAMILGATSLFSQLQDALNLVWGVKPRIAAGLRGYARHMLLKRLLSFGFVVLVGVALLVLLVTKTVVATLAAFVVGPNPFVLQAGELAISIALGTGLFAVLFRWLPDGTIGWRHALVGGIATATLVSIAAMGVGYYLAHVGARSTYGAAGAVTAILLWAFVSAQAFFWSASFTVAHAAVYGDGVRLDPHVRRTLAAGPAVGRHA